MSTEYRVGFGVGILVVAVLIVGFIYLVRKASKNPGPCEYDERQELVRGRGYKYGFFTFMIYGLFYGLLEAYAGDEAIIFEMGGTGIVVGIIVALTVFGTYCIWNGAYMTRSESPKASTLLLGGVGVWNFVIGIAYALHGELFVNGKLTFKVTNLLIGITFLLFSGIFIIRNRMDSRQEE